MSGDRTRRPERPPSSAYRSAAERTAEPSRPRGPVVRRAADPDELAEEEHKQRQWRFRAESARAQAELQRARARGHWKGRGLGALLVVIGVSLTLSTVHELSQGYYSQRAAMLAPVAILVGGWYAVVGSGGAASVRDAPGWVKIGGLVLGLIGMIWGATGWIGFLARTFLD